MSLIRSLRSSNRRLLLLLLGGVAAWAAAVPAQAQGADAFPSRPITLLYPYAAGSNVDVAWRTIAAVAGRLLGQPVVVENRPGSAGRNVINAMANAPKTGYVLGIGSSGEMMVQGAAEPKWRTEPGRDYLPITLAFKNYQALVANPSVPFRDLAGLVAYDRENPGKLNLGTAGVGTPGHLAVEMLNSVAGTRITHVPYKGGAAALVGVAGGEIQLGVSDATSRQFVTAGRLVGLATTGQRRWRVFPEVPTVQEAGYPNFEVSVWLALVAPAGTPPEVVRRLHQAFTAALKTPEVVEKLEGFGMEIVGSTPEELAATWKQDMVRWEPLVKRIGLKFD